MFVTTTPVDAQFDRWGSARPEAWAWNLGTLAVIVGTLAAVPTLTTLGALLTAGALGLFLRGAGGGARSPRAALLLYRGVGAIVLASIPVGLSLAWVRHG